MLLIHVLSYQPIVAVRASITGWLTLHRQTKLIAPSGFIRLPCIIVVFFTLYILGYVCQQE